MMMKEWLQWVNAGVAALALFLLLLALVLMIFGRSEIVPQDFIISPKRLPDSSFTLSQEAYDSIGDSVLKLQTAPITLQLPDLRQVLVYYGKNNRPDVDPAAAMMHFGFAGTKTTVSIPQNAPVFLLYDKKQTPPRYQFSPDNSETSLWIEAYASGSNAIVKVRMKNDKGELVAVPSANAEFSLPEKPFVRSDPVSWEIGKQRVDGTLLARQRARWYGTDRFFERHGGKEYESLVGKERIDFGEGTALTSVFVKTGDVLIWDQDRWKVVEPGEETLGKPILLVKKVDDRLISFELWDAEGKTKVPVNLLKTNEPAIPTNLMQAFKYVGSRTRSQFVFEVNKERLTLSPLDWILQTNNTWKKLTTPEEIDLYVDRKEIGYLFVFDGIERRDDRQVVIGVLFNKARSDYKHIEMTLEAGAPLIPAPSASKVSARPPVIQKTPPSKQQKTAQTNGPDEEDDDEDDE